MEQTKTDLLRKTWHPTDFGFYEVLDRPGTYLNGQYELRKFPEDMWLLRRQKDGKYLVKAYYTIKFTDYEFANWLFNKRLNKF